MKNLYYIMNFFKNDKDSIVKQVLLESVNIHSNGNTSFYFNTSSNQGRGSAGEHVRLP